MSDRIDQMKKDAVAFYTLMFNDCLPQEAIDRYVVETYIQHNPEVADGKQAFIEYFERMATEYPGKKVEVKRPFQSAQKLIEISCRSLVIQIVK